MHPKQITRQKNPSHGHTQRLKPSTTGFLFLSLNPTTELAIEVKSWTKKLYAKNSFVFQRISQFCVININWDLMSLKHYPSYDCMVGWFCFKLIWVLLPQMSWIDLWFLAWVHLGFVAVVWLGFGGCGWLVVANGCSWGIWSPDRFQCLVTSKVEERKKN